MSKVEFYELQDRIQQLEKENQELKIENQSLKNELAKLKQKPNNNPPLKISFR